MSVSVVSSILQEAPAASLLVDIGTAFLLPHASISALNNAYFLGSEAFVGSTWQVSSHHQTTWKSEETSRQLVAVKIRV
jgi:hypothetical protein